MRNREKEKKEIIVGRETKRKVMGEARNALLWPGEGETGGGA
jgi:hypothetical protein